jgi:hypothetical protein
MTVRMGRSMRIGGTAHDPGTPIPPPDLSKVTVMVAPVRRQTARGGPTVETATATAPDWQSPGFGVVAVARSEARARW